MPEQLYSAQYARRWRVLLEKGKSVVIEDSCLPLHAIV
jgi:hypothetical protein